MSQNTQKHTEALGQAISAQPIPDSPESAERASASPARMHRLCAASAETAWSGNRLLAWAMVDGNLVELEIPNHPRWQVALAGEHVTWATREQITSPNVDYCTNCELALTRDTNLPGYTACRLCLRHCEWCGDLTDNTETDGYHTGYICHNCTDTCNVCDTIYFPEHLGSRRGMCPDHAYYEWCNYCDDYHSGSPCNYDCDDDCDDEPDEYYDWIQFLENNTFTKNPFKRTVGLEIELQYRSGYRPEVPRELGGWHNDSSIYQPLGCGTGEFVTNPAWGDDLLTLLTNVAEKLNRCRTDASCGLHVHINASDLTDQQVTNIHNAWFRLQDLFFSVIKPTRRGNVYCRPNDVVIDKHDRYKALNVSARQKHGTLEFRLHHGSLGPYHGWVMLLLNFVETFKDIPDISEVAFLTPRGKAIYLFQQCKLPYSLKREIVARLKEHSPEVLCAV